MGRIKGLCQLFCNVEPKKPEAIHKLHALSVYVKGEVVWNYLFDPGGVGFTLHHQVPL